MKFCPVCHQRYEDAQNFCLDDGTSLEVFSAESQVPTAHFVDLSDLTVKPTEASPTIYLPEQRPSPTYPPQNQDTLTSSFAPIELPQRVPSPKANSLLIALISIFGTLCAVGIIGASVWFWSGNSQTSNEIVSNAQANSSQKNSPNLKSNTSNNLSRSNQTENSRPDKKSSTGDNSNLTVSGNNKTEITPVNSSPTPFETSTVDLQVKFTNLGKTQNYPVSGGSISIQTDGKTLTASTNNAGIAYFKGVSCRKPVRITLKSEDGSGTFTRNLKCGANTSWSYQTDCFVSGKNGGCAVEQVN